MRPKEDLEEIGLTRLEAVKKQAGFGLPLGARKLGGEVRELQVGNPSQGRFFPVSCHVGAPSGTETHNREGYLQLPRA